MEVIRMVQTHCCSGYWIWNCCRKKTIRQIHKRTLPLGYKGSVLLFLLFCAVPNVFPTLCAARQIVDRFDQGASYAADHKNSDTNQNKYKSTHFLYLFTRYSMASR